MSYQALYRKFRPQTFDEVKGQDAIVRTLKNQIVNDKLAHAYIFTGTRGTGKTSVAKLFAKAVNCEDPQDGSPCGKCASCLSVASGASLNVVEMDAASNNSVEDARRIVEEVEYSPTSGRFRVYIIDEAHMVTDAAFNALLKTIEEPPPYLIFIFATTDIQQVPITILSRCQRYDFRRIELSVIADRMKELMAAEGVTAEDKALLYIARCADGSMRDALSLLDQCIAFNEGGDLTYDKVLEVLGAVDTGVFSDFLGCLLKKDISGCIRMLEDAVMRGRELTQFVSDLIGHLRNLLLVKTADNIDDVMNVSSDHIKRLKEEAAAIDDERLMYYIRTFADLASDIKYSAQKRILIELAVIRLCRPQTKTDMQGILERIRTLEDKVERGVVAVPAGAQVQAFAPAEGGKAPAAPKPEELIAALPEDVKKCVEKWKLISDEMGAYLTPAARMARLSVEGDKLIILFHNRMHYELFTNAESPRLIKQAIEKYIQKEVKFEVRYSEMTNNIDEMYPDLGNLINFDIEEEQ